MNYLSVCSGIEAASVAWEPLGWRPAAFAEIEKFPSAVLAGHWPDVPNLGDLTKIKGEDFCGLVDLIVGGTPCQSFSVAGLREGLDDPRGDLTLKFFKLARRVRARWLVWENVPGILSHDGGRTFGVVLGAMAECGYGFAYRVLDAQYFGVPQRRRRVFLVGHLGDWRCAAAVLFERHSLCRHSAPRRRAPQKLAGTLAASTFTGGPGGRPESGAGNHFIAHPLNGHGRRWEPESETFIAHSLRGEGFDASEDGTGRQNLVVVFHGGQDPDISGQVTHPLGVNHGLEACVATVSLRGREGGATAEMGGPVATALRSSQGGGDKPHLLYPAGVRRLTPLECERLQGFPDYYTLIPWRGKPAFACPDGPRYKALGNSMAVPVMRWIGERIALVDKLPPAVAPAV